MAQKFTMSILPCHSLLCLVAPVVSCMLKLGSCCGRIFAGFEFGVDAVSLWKVSHMPIPTIAARARFRTILLLFTVKLLPYRLFYMGSELICRDEANNSKFSELSAVTIEEYDAGRAGHTKPALE